MGIEVEQTLIHKLTVEMDKVTESTEEKELWVEEQLELVTNRGAKSNMELTALYVIYMNILKGGDHHQ